MGEAKRRKQLDPNYGKAIQEKESPEKIVSAICQRNVLNNIRAGFQLTPDQNQQIDRIEQFFKRIGLLIREGNQAIPEDQSWGLEKLYRSYYTELYQIVDVGWDFLCGDDEDAKWLREEILIPEAMQSPKTLLQALVTQDAFGMVLPFLQDYYDLPGRRYYDAYNAKMTFLSGDPLEIFENKGRKGFKKKNKKQKELDQHMTPAKMEAMLPKWIALQILRNYRKQEPTLQIHINSFDQISDELEKRGKRTLKNSSGVVSKRGKVERKGKGGKLS